MMRLVCIAVAVCGLAAAMEPPALEASLRPAAIPFHLAVEYTLSVEASSSATVEFPEILSEAGRLEILGNERATEPLGNDRMRFFRRYRVEPVFPGIYTMPPATITWRDGEEEGVLSTPALAFHARALTEAEEQTVSQFAGMAEPIAVFPDREGSRRWLTIAGTLMALGAVALALWWRFGRTTAEASPPAASAWEVALNRLNELRRRDLPNTGRTDAYYVDLSSILRYYIEDRFYIHAPEQTTPEFLDMAHGLGVFSDEQRAFLEEFLRQCDRVKFARMQPGLDDMAAHFTQVKHFIVDTIPANEASSLERAA